MRRPLLLLLVAAALAGPPTATGAQEQPGGIAAPQAPPPLFASHDELAITLTADFTQLERDRGPSPDRPAVLTVDAMNGDSVEITTEIRTRGNFRLDPSNCSFPPLRLDVPAREAEGTVFEGQDDLKIVSSCRPANTQYDRLVPLEYLAYRALNQVTDRSLRVRPLRLTLVDTGPAGDARTRFAFFIEDEDALAERFGATAFEMEDDQVLPASAFDQISLVTTGVFEYMIGNTDWSDVAGHNVEILERGGVGIVVPYDFDYSGLVDAPYAVPADGLGLDTVRERVYRGWCASEPVTRLVLDRFREARTAVVRLFEDDERLHSDDRARSLSYLERFFDDIETDERADRRFLRHCRRA